MWRGLLHGSYPSTSFYLSRPAPLVPHLSCLSSRCRCTVSSAFRGVVYHPTPDSMLSLQLGSCHSTCPYHLRRSLASYRLLVQSRVLPYVCVGDPIESCDAQRPSCHLHFCHAHLLFDLLGYWPCLRSVESHWPNHCSVDS